MVVQWTDAAGLTGMICNGCVGYLLSDREAEIGPARLGSGER